MGSGIE
jgi:hypothetical protein